MASPRSQPTPAAQTATADRQPIQRERSSVQQPCTDQARAGLDPDRYFVNNDATSLFE
jgi:hypothetical protein